MTGEHFIEKQRVYAHIRGRGWCVAQIDKINQREKKMTVVPESPPRDNCTIPIDQAHIIIPNSYDVNDDDLFRVGDLHTATLLHCLKDRVEKGQKQYSKMGEMVLSVNPFANMPFNGVPERKKYLDARDPFALPPHIWQIAEKAYLAVVARKLDNQSVVISGESGSGKTENTKALIAYLGELSAKHSCNPIQNKLVERVNEALYQSNPVLESFGNARTVRNDNSSRFGKYIKLFFDPTSGIMIGGEMITYLLEKSRIVRVCEGERAYHIFYEMLAGLSAEQKQKLGGLKTARDYPSLAGGNTFTRRGVDGRELDDKVEFQKVVKGLEVVGFSNEQREAVWAVLAAVLHLQELEFAQDAQEKAVIKDDAPLQRACEQLRVDVDKIRECLLIKSKTRVLTALSTVVEASAMRDSMCKALYLGLFDSIVEKVNRAIAPTVSTASAKYIGLLDIFGFENFKVNSFEQVCINFANESLQNHYNKFTFVNDEAECKAEGIEIPDIVFPDNTDCLHLFNKKGTGVFAMLDEQCYVPGGNAPRYTERMWEEWRSSPAMLVPKSTDPTNFTVRHYAADVQYMTHGWLEKNSDPLKEDIRTTLQATSHAESGFVGHLLDKADAAPSDGQNRKRVSVATTFQTQLLDLRTELESTETHFIRCIKPNMLAKPGIVENDHVTSQLESAGVLQTIELKRQGYPVRRKLQDFAAFFHSIASPKVIGPLMKAGKYRDACGAILNLYSDVFGWKGKMFAAGTSKVFLKADAWNALERTLYRRNKMRVRRCQPLLVRWSRNWQVIREERLKREREAQIEAMKRAAHDRLTRDAAACGPEKIAIFERVCLLFPRMDPTLIFDVVLQTETEAAAIAALSEMRAQELDKYLPANFLSLMRRMEVRDCVTREMLSNGIDTVGALYSLTENALDTCGATGAEKQRIMEAIVAQESQAVHNERLLVSGTGRIQSPTSGDLTEDFSPTVQQELADMAMRLKIARNDQINHLMTVLGCNKKQAEDALKECDGDEAKASMMVMDQRFGTSNGRVANMPISAAGKALDQRMQKSLQKVINMGIPEEKAIAALQRAKGNPEQAIEFVFAERS